MSRFGLFGPRCLSLCRSAWVSGDFQYLVDGLPVGRNPLSFHSVSFGLDEETSSLRRMTEIALEIQNNAPRSRGLVATSIPSSFTVASNTVSTPNLVLREENDAEPSQVQLAETFLGFAESLRKPRGSLIH